MMKPDQWFALVFGRGMYNVDMVRFSDQGVEDLFSSGYREPAVDAQNDFDTLFQGEKDGWTWIQASRLLETGDSQDEELSCGNTYEF